MDWNKTAPSSAPIWNDTNTTAVEETEASLNVIQLLCFPVIIALGLIGNSVICLAVYNRSRLRIIDYFIMNLAATDLATCIISVPFDFVEILSAKWPFGSFLCKIVYPLQTMLISVAVYTLLCMSLERRRAIIRPFKPRIKSRRVLLIIALLWVFSISLVGPYIDVLALNTNSSQCIERWPDAMYPKAFTLSVFVVLYLFPLIVIGSNYVAISAKLYKDIQRVRKAIGEASGHGKKPLAKRRSHRNMRIVKIFIALVVAFALCMAPNHIMWIWHDYGDGGANPHFSTLLVFSNILMYSNSAINPFIFVFLHSRYCKDLFRFCHCNWRKFCPARKTPKRHIKKVNKKSLFSNNNFKSRCRPQTKRYDQKQGILHPRNLESNLLFKDRVFGKSLENGEVRATAWRRFDELGAKTKLVAEPGLLPRRKPRVNFGGEKIIHIDQENNIEMESAI